MERHALVQTLVDDNLRLCSQLRGGDGPRCTKPWSSLEERSSAGRVKPCCWYTGTLGHIRGEQDVTAIWNDEPYRALRRDMVADRLPPHCPSWCPLLSDPDGWFEKQTFYDYRREELATFDAPFLANRAAVMRAALGGDAALTGIYPVRLHLHPSDVCNLRCIMCYLDLDSGRRRNWYSGPRLSELMRYLEEIKVFGGEPLFCETSRALIFDTRKPRWTHTSFLTNGTLVTERVIEALEAVRIGSIDVSLDAATAATYARIRLRGNFDKALGGAGRLVDLGRRHSIRRFSVFADFVAQEANYRELRAFVGLCSDTGLTPNFTVVTASPEAHRRALMQRTDGAVRPQSFRGLNDQLEKALVHAERLNMRFAVRSLRRVQQQVTLPQ
jgi:MoaA/NifB/PqqE/SkfB family radical SAM enzyme